jgi:hypothetical protein
MDDKGRGRAEALEDKAEDESQEMMKEGITTLVGAALGEQECWERTACKAGEYAATIPGSQSYGVQCCQGAEISAEKHKMGRKKLCGAGKIWGRTFGRFIKKGPKRGRTFL